MKKSLSAISVLICTTVSHAGGMGDISQQQPCLTPFISLEGAYIWGQAGSISLNTISRNPSTTSWGGRLAVGASHPYSDKLGFTSELGGAYYGSYNLDLSLAGITVRTTIDGYDLLFGAVYKLPIIDVYGKVGVMVQNYRSKVTEDYSLSIPGGLNSGTSVVASSQTQALPEVKVGGIYNFNDNWALSLAYMHVFGSSPFGSDTISQESGAFVQDTNRNTQNPTLSSIMLGLQYNIV